MGKKRSGRQRLKWLNSITDSMEMSLSKLGETRKLGVLLFMELQRIRHDLVIDKQIFHNLGD